VLALIDAHAALSDVVTAASEILSLPRHRAKRLAGLRAEALESVLLASDRVGASVRGSWRWGDFQLDERSGRSCSDLDLWHPLPRAVASVETRAGLLRATIHADDYEATLTLEVSLCFALVNLATARLLHDDDPYRLAKCQLMLARRRVSERYADVAARVGPPGASALALPLSFISGAFFAKDTFPEVLQALAAILPLSHLIELTRDVMVFDDTVWDHLGNVAVVVAWGLAGLVVAVRGFRWEPRER